MVTVIFVAAVWGCPGLGPKPNLNDFWLRSEMESARGLFLLYDV